MKKILAIIPAILLCYMVNAQDNGQPVYLMRYDSEMFQIAATIFVVGMFMYFIITVMKRIFEHRLKNKIVDKGISENIAHSLLETKTTEDNKYANVKWFAILAGIGLGLTGVNYTQPLGFHSLAIMAFSISLSFLGYYFFIRYTEK
jgi:drug/metabolite transporter (DMT)-like permease